MIPSVYLAGPMSGYPNYNYPAFHDAEVILRDHGFAVMSPTTLYRHDGTYEYYMREAIRMLLQCQVVALLPEWQESEGAKLEVRVASMCGLLVYGLDKLLAQPLDEVRDKIEFRRATLLV